MSDGRKIFMNIHLLIQSVENLDLAFAFTIDATERSEIAALAEGVRKLLRKRGVFLGITKEQADCLPKEPDANSSHQ